MWLDGVTIGRQDRMAWDFAAMEKGEKMSKYIEAVSAATIIAEKHGIPIAELVDTFAEIPDAELLLH